MTAEGSAQRAVAGTVRALLAQGERDLLINLDSVKQMDTSGLTEIVESYTTTTRNGGRLKLVHVPRHVYTLLRVTRLATVFETFDSECDALASFENAVSGPG
ncbi:MAG TPA: STAS domain-containing protein, partial [Vicinamibacterales bacterium]